ncbi:homoserine kinase [Abditibacterium utsteinense]|uniref:Homoserine kinase n=1 Tax=Abditibacterium utsteinense TaxID=1960156 RepID=A0A2S8SV26_9BACT|nr:homoserine kinase [Abditibacterium utsteinense]PQV64642.1 homoserine kinase [Abditibacterium utsteinense]
MHSHLISNAVSSSDAVTVRVPATSANCGPGFDCLGLALSLHNEITLKIGDSDALQVAGEGVFELQNNSQTIAHHAAHRVFKALSISISGVQLSLKNQIPLSRGLGSSSAAIVGGLVAANAWAQKNRGLELSKENLLDLATEIEGHPDNVAPALLGGFVVSARNENGAVASIQLPIQKFPRFAVWIPETELATKVARGVLPESYSRADAVFNLSRSALLVAALATNDFEALREALRDKIHQDFRAPLVPAFEEISRAALENGAFGVTLSGAGPSILAWLPEGTGAIDAMKNAAFEAKVKGRVVELEVDELGCTT